MEPPLPPLVDAADEPVWWDDEAEDYRTSFPLAPGAEWVDQDGRYGDPGYARALTDDERAVLEALDDMKTAENRVIDTAARAAWFAGLEVRIAAAEQAGQGERERGMPPTICRSPAKAGAWKRAARKRRTTPRTRSRTARQARTLPHRRAALEEEDSTPPPFVSSEVETPAPSETHHSAGADEGVNPA